MHDASFLEGREEPVRLVAADSDDLAIIATLCQDAIAERKQMQFERDRHVFSLLLKRFRWEDADDAKSQNRPFERVQSVLQIQSALGVRSTGFDNNDANLAFELIGIAYEGDEIRLTFAGDGEIAVKVEAVDLILSDVSRPYVARAKTEPNHDDETA